MKYVVNLRGINASGKSTVVRQFCEKNKMTPEILNFNGIEWKVMTNGCFLAVGHYRPYSKSEGCDPLKANKDDFKKFICWLLKMQRYELVIYEKQIWSTTYKLTSEIAQICKKSEYEFIAIQMCIEYQTALNRLLNRNGGDIGNLDNFDARFYGVYSSRKNLIKNGFFVFDANVEKIKETEMGQLISEVVNMFESGKRGGILNGFVQHTE